MLRIQRSSHLQDFQIILQFSCDFWGFHTKPTITCGLLSLCLGCNTKNNKCAFSNQEMIEQGTLSSKRYLEYSSVPLRSIFNGHYNKVINDRFVPSEHFHFTVRAFHGTAQEDIKLHHFQCMHTTRAWAFSQSLCCNLRHDQLFTYPALFL